MKRAMRAVVVSAPTRVARMRRRPPSNTVPDNTLSPTSLRTAKFSPVTEAWLTAALPPTTLPSMGIISPGPTSIRSPARNSPQGICTNPPLRSTQA